MTFKELHEETVQQAVNVAVKNSLSTDCPARQMARQFIAKFNQDDGRGKSLQKAIIAEDVTSKTRKAARAKVDSFLANPPWNRLGFIGRFGDNFIRNYASDCDIGDVIPLEYAAELSHENGFRTWLAGQGIYTFTKVSCEMTSDNGHTWQTCWFWKRVS